MTDTTVAAGSIKSVEVYILNRERLKSAMRRIDGMSHTQAEQAIEFMTKFGNPTYASERGWRADRIARDLHMQDTDPNYVFDVLRNTYANEIIVYDKTYDAPVPAVKPEKIVPVREAKPKAPPVPRAPRMPTPAKPTAEKLREPWERATEIQVTVTNAEALREHLMSTRALNEKEAGRVMLFLDTMKNGNPGPELRAEFARQLHMKQKSYDRAVERATFFADVALGALPISVRGLAAERPDLVQITYPEPVTG